MDEDFKRQLIDGFQKPGRVVIEDANANAWTRPLDAIRTQAEHFSDPPVEARLNCTEPEQPSSQNTGQTGSSASVEPQQLASTATSDGEGAKPEVKTEQELLPPAGASQTPPEARTSDPPPEHIRAMKAITASNNAYSGFFESNHRLIKHQERIDDDHFINQIRTHMAMFPPRPLADDVEVSAELPIGLLPPLFAELIRTASAYFGPAPEMPLVAGLGAIFIAGRGNYAIRIGPQHCEALTAYLVGAAASGQRKSAVVGYFRSFFEEVEREMRANHAEEGIETAQELSQIAVKRIKAELADEFSDVAKTAGIRHARSAFKGKIVALERTAKSLRVAKREPRLLTDITTPEKLAEDLESQGEAIGILVAEGGYWKRMIARYDDLALRAYTGEPFSSSTRSVASIHLRTPIMAICTLVQPEVLNALFENEGLAAHGLTARILPVYIPSRKSGAAGPEIPDELTSWLRERIRTLLHVQRAETPDGVRVPHVIDIEKEGKTHIRRYQEKVKEELAAGGFEHFQPFGDKLVGHAIRLAGAIHLIKHPDPHNHLIDAQSILAGIALAEFFRRHAEIAFSSEKRDGAEFARKILACIAEDPALVRFSPRDMQRRFHGARAHQVQAGLTILERHNFVHRYVRRGRIDYIVHPYAHWWLKTMAGSSKVTH